MPTKNRNLIRCMGTGFIALDVIRSDLDDSTTLERCHAGGSCGNVLSILSYLGVPSSAVGRVGEDVAGKKLLADLRRYKVDVKLLVREVGRRTPIVIQRTYLDRYGNPRHRFSRACPVCGSLMPGYRPLRAIDVPELASVLPPHTFFFFDRVARGNIELARRSRRQGALVVFEPSGIKNEGLFLECLSVSHVLKYSHECFSNLDTLVSRARPRLEIATLGADGLRFRIRASGPKGKWRQLPALAAPAVRDTAGSGDWCTAGLIFGLAKATQSTTSLLQDIDSLAEILRFGQALATVNCAYDGARGMMYEMTRERALGVTERMLSNGDPRLPESSFAATTAVRPVYACVVCAQAGAAR